MLPQLSGSNITPLGTLDSQGSKLLPALSFYTVFVAITVYCFCLIFIVISFLIYFESYNSFEERHFLAFECLPFLFQYTSSEIHVKVWTLLFLHRIVTTFTFGVTLIARVSSF